ncbi:hypothetical protein HY024_00740 [Candidatus Curtissbacteria bacterium]|nr:hypothetical protein [Candidatus Curtissbacteria bacterium]
MIDRVIGYIATWPPLEEARIGVIGSVSYGAVLAFPEKFQELAANLPIAGEVIGNFSAGNIRTAAGEGTIMCGVIAFDGLKRLVKATWFNNTPAD